MFFARLEELLYILFKNFASYRIKPIWPVQLPGGGYSEDALTKYANDSVKAYSKFLLAQMFHAAALENVQWLISHKDQTWLMADDAYELFFTEHRVKMDRRSSALNAIKEEPLQGENEQEIEDFPLQLCQQPWPAK